jgi:uncharacterized SAM-binding protein YcdF (DUF218 family)
MLSYAATRLSLSRFLDPLFLFLIALAVLLYVAFRGSAPMTAWARRARVAAWAAWGGLWLVSLPYVSAWLTYAVELHGPNLDEALAGRDMQKAALVVLAAGIRTYEPDVPPRERMDGPSTQRTLTAARIYQQHGFGLVVATGSPQALPYCMKDLLVAMGVPADRVAVETQSINTRENAAFSAEILRARGIETVVVVTSATHLRRAVKAFARVGIQAIPAAADSRGMGRLGLEMLIPSSSGIVSTHVALHEILGYLRI